MKKLKYLIFIICLFIFTPKVHAISFDPYTWNNKQIGTTSYTTIAKNGTLSFDLDLTYTGSATDEITNKYGLLNAWNGSSGSNGTAYNFIVSVCSNGGSLTGFANSNNSLVKTVDSGLNCTIAGYTSNYIYYFVKLTPNVYNVGNSTTYYVNWNSTLTFTNSYNYAIFFRVSSVDIYTDSEFTSLLNDANNTSKLNQQIKEIQETNDKLDTQISQNEEIINKQEETNNLIGSESSDVNSSSCGIICKLKAMINFINPLSKDFFAYKLVELLLNMLKSLFIPEDMDFVTNFVEALESKLGFIASIPVAIIEFTLNLASATWTEFTSVSFPSISIFGYNFWNAQEIDLTEAINIFKPFKYITDCICVVICARTLNKWRERFTGGGK